MSESQFLTGPEVTNITLEIVYFTILVSVLVIEAYALYAQFFSAKSPTPTVLTTDLPPEECLDGLEAGMVSRGFSLAARGRASVALAKRKVPSGGMVVGYILISLVAPTIYMCIGYVDVRPTIEVPEFPGETSTVGAQSPIEMTGQPQDIGTATLLFIAGLLPLFVYLLLVNVAQVRTTVAAVASGEGSKVTVASEDESDRALVSTWLLREARIKKP